MKFRKADDILFEQMYGPETDELMDFLEREMWDAIMFPPNRSEGDTEE